MPDYWQAMLANRMSISNASGRLIDTVETLRSALIEARPQTLNSVRECEFLNTIRHRSSIPGGTCMFDLPDYGFWLRLPLVERTKHFANWADAVRPVCDAVAEVLWLTRQANEPVDQIAKRWHVSVPHGS